MICVFDHATIYMYMRLSCICTVYIHALPVDMSETKLRPRLFICNCRWPREDYDRPNWYPRKSVLALHWTWTNWRSSKV